MQLPITFSIVLLLTIRHSNELFKNKYMQNMKEKAKQYYKSKFGKQGLNFLGHDLSEYPGINKVYRRQNKEKWDEYYKCLDMQKTNLGYHKSFTPEAVQNLEGNSVRFDCTICINPMERDNSESVEWEFGYIDDNYLSPIEFTEYILVSPEDKSLTIYNLQEENSGQYVCRVGQTITAPIYLTVIKANQNFTEVHPEQALKGPYPIPPKVLEKLNIVIDTTWTDWSPCSRCDRVGRRHRYGHCIVLYNRIEQRSVDVHSNDTDEAKEIPQDEIDLLKIFREGIPCQSYILPDAIKEIPEIKERSTEIMIGYCKVRCPKAKVFKVKDSAGRVLETANNSAGVYSMLQPIPPLEPQIRTTVVYRSNGDEIIIACPGNLNSDTPVHWQIGGKNVIPELIKEKSEGRIFITLLDKVHIDNAKVSDSNLYSCWQNNALAGAVRLVVEKKIRMNLNHHIMLVGVVAILSTFLYVFVKAFFGRKYAKTY